MLTNFLKVTLRNLYREKVYAIINISGLAIAIATCIVLGLYIRSELTYDHHNINYKRIFKIINTFAPGNTPTVFPALGPSLARDYTEIKGFVRMAYFNGDESLIGYGDKRLFCNNIYYADNSIFDIFTHEVIYGDPKVALVDPTSVAISESFMKKSFRGVNPVGELISIDKKPYKISLVFADLPENTTVKYDVLVSYHAKELADAEANINPLYILNTITYLLMPQGYKADDFKSISESIYSRYLSKGPLMIPNESRYWLQPMSDIHFNSDILFTATGNKFYVYGFTAVAIFILLVACINYMNLATARASKRAKEVGIRKTLGSSRIGLRFQFLGEAFFFSLVALFFGLVLSEIALNLTPINQLLDKHLALNFGRDPGLIFWLLAFSLFIGFMSGAYPALYLSSIPVLSALKSGHRAGKGGIRVRQVLVLIQLTLTVTVIACTFLMALQMRYVSGKPLGFEKGNRVIIPLMGADVINQIPVIKNELLRNGRILGITQSDAKIGEYLPRGSTSEGILSYLSVEDNFLEIMGMKLVSGRDFSKKLLTDVNGSYLVNETLVKKMGWNEPLGKSIQIIGYNAGRVIGVVKDFHFNSLHSPVEPLILRRLSELSPEIVEQQRILLTVHISEKEVSNTLAFLREKFAEFDPNHSFQYEFQDDSLDKLYLSENRLMKLIGIFGGVCILLSCMGLFGLAAFTTEQRTKEIGVRKVLGATTWQIITMLSNKILLLVLGGSIIASAIAYSAMDEWLTSFAYRTGINPLVFVISAIVAAVVAFLTVALQSYKTARANPVEALRYE